MTMPTGIHTMWKGRSFGKVVKRFLGNEVPARVLEFTGRATYELYQEAIAASPVGPPPNEYKTFGRGKLGEGGGYGPISKAWRRKYTHSLKKKAMVFNVAFYARMNAYGTARTPANPYFFNLKNRVNAVGRRALAQMKKA